VKTNERIYYISSDTGPNVLKLCVLPFILSTQVPNIITYFLGVCAALEAFSHAQIMCRGDTVFVTLSMSIRFSLSLFPRARVNGLYNLYHYPNLIFCDLEGAK
jgi:hypothetical protein